MPALQAVYPQDNKLVPPPAPNPQLVKRKVNPRLKARRHSLRLARNDWLETYVLAQYACLVLCIFADGGPNQSYSSLGGHERPRVREQIEVNRGPRILLFARRRQVTAHGVLQK